MILQAWTLSISSANTGFATTEPPAQPVNRDLVGLTLTTAAIDLEASAHTGQDLILGNLLYNVSNLLNSGSSRPCSTSWPYSRNNSAAAPVP